MKRKERKGHFLIGDWKSPIAAGLVLSFLMAALLFVGEGGGGEVALGRDIADISASFAFTFIGVLLTFYSLVQVLVDKKWMQDRVVHIDYWASFKLNLVMVIKILAFLFFVSLFYIGVDCVLLSAETLEGTIAAGWSWFAWVLDWFPETFIVFASFAMGVALERICITAGTFIKIIAN